MANFKTHLSVAATLSGVVAIGCLEAGIATPKDVLMYFAVGTLGGILPDIDSNHSVPVQIMFSFLAVALAFLVVFSKTSTYSLAELTLLWLAVYLSVRHVVGRLFAIFTEHRGVFHSLLAVLFFWFLATTLAYRLLAQSPFQAWLTGGFVGLGYLVHLSLDELYSVDLLGARLKTSFGTALKPISIAHFKATAALVAATLLLYLFMVPPPMAFFSTLSSGQVYKSLRHKLLPKDRWFRLSEGSDSTSAWQICEAWRRCLLW